MAKVHLFDTLDAPLKARPFFANGTPNSIARALAHVPELMEKALPFIGAIYGPSAIPPRPKEIVVVRISALLSCRFCTETHSFVALDSGLSVAEIRALRDPQAPIEDVFPSPDERALIAWSARFASAEPLGEADHALLAEHFAEHEIVELGMIAGTTLLLNRFCSALELPPAPAVLERLAVEGIG